MCTDLLDHYTTAYKSLVRSALAHIYNNTRPSDDCSKWLEVNEIKYLFHSPQAMDKSTSSSIHIRRMGLYGL